MARKPISEAVQANIFLHSRRRCCLCFWLKGEDEVKKGQIAHLDQDNENNAESNLAFLCFDHHDEYDSTTRQSKGLSQAEVRRWRDELYKEMRYRFRTMKTKAAELSLVGLFLRGTFGEFTGRFRVKNTGEVGLRGLMVSFQLPDRVRGEIPPQRVRESSGVAGLVLDYTMPDLWAAHEERQDLFEPNGRVCVKTFPPMAYLMPGHSDTFDALLFHLAVTRPGESLEIRYQVDAEDMPSAQGALTVEVPSDALDQLKGSTGGG